MTRPTRIPWAQAVWLFDEQAITQGYSPQRVSNWRQGGVPWNVLITLFRKTLHEMSQR